MPPFQNYFQQINQQNLNNQELNLQRQIEGLNAQLQQTQALRNQMMQQQYQQPQAIPGNVTMTQPAQMGIVTQVVEEFENISVNSVPMDNNGAFFVKRDGTEIQLKRWNGNGQIETTSYLPQIQNEVVNTPQEEVRTQNDALNEVVGVFNNRFDGVESRISEIEQIITNSNNSNSVRNQSKTTPKTKSTKKEVDTDGEQ